MLTDKAFVAFITLIGLDFHMLAEMYFKIIFGVVLLSTPVNWTNESELVVVGSLMVFKNALPLKNTGTARKWALKFFNNRWNVSGHVVGQMLRYFENFFASLDRALVGPQWHVVGHVPLQLWVARELTVTAINDALNVLYLELFLFLDFKSFSLNFGFYILVPCVFSTRNYSLS